MSPRFAQTGPGWPGTGLVAVFPRHCGQGRCFRGGPFVAAFTAGVVMVAGSVAIVGVALVEASRDAGVASNVSTMALLKEDTFKVSAN